MTRRMSNLSGSQSYQRKASLFNRSQLMIGLLGGKVL
jgi:hypothetical protein